MKLVVLFAALIVVSLALPLRRETRGTKRTEHAEKTINKNGDCFKVVYDLNVTDESPNARGVCTMTKCGQSASDRVPCRTYFPDKE